MTRAASRPGNAVAPHFAPESFLDAAHAELTLAAPWTEGVCFNPACSRPFTPVRSWQIYCCAACKNTGTQEMRSWGHKMALPLLVHRVGKYQRGDADVVNVTRAARRYVTQVQSAWLKDREARRQGGGS
jgi:hypothetical protein